MRVSYSCQKTELSIWLDMFWRKRKKKELTSPDNWVNHLMTRRKFKLQILLKLWRNVVLVQKVRLLVYLAADYYLNTLLNINFDHDDVLVVLGTWYLTSYIYLKWSPTSFGPLTFLGLKKFESREVCARRDLVPAWKLLYYIFMQEAIYWSIHCID